MNTLFPGRPKYVGPQFGLFGLLHHDALWEYSHNVMERVKDVKQNKPESEQEIRLHNMISLGDCAVAYTLIEKDAAYRLQSNGFYTRYKRILVGLYGPNKGAHASEIAAEYVRKEAEITAKLKAQIELLRDEVILYIKGQIPDCAWNGRELVFPE